MLSSGVSGRRPGVVGGSVVELSQSMSPCLVKGPNWMTKDRYIIVSNNINPAWHKIHLQSVHVGRRVFPDSP